MFSIVPIESPTLVTEAISPTAARLRSWSTRSATSTVCLSSPRWAGVRITHVFETHIHNDYVTGGFALAKATGAAYHVNAADNVAYQRVPTHDCDVIDVSDALRIRVIATPGHTYTHLSYSLESTGEHVGVFSGGSLLFGSTGRPDLLVPDHAHALVHHQFASAHRLVAELPDQAQVLPTHGFGSFCAATES
jgi:hydroxyacylglutathione hydrolase